MKVWSNWVAAALLATGLGCGAGTGGPDVDDPFLEDVYPDGGYRGLTIAAIFGGIVVTDHPFAGGPNLWGGALVQKDGRNVGPATTVTVNGFPTVRSEEFVNYFGLLPDGTLDPNAGAGKSVVIRAEDETDSESFSVPCPSGVSIASPRDGAQAQVGSDVRVTWNGDIHAHRSFAFRPRARVYVESRGEFDPRSSFEIEEGATSLDIWTGYEARRIAIELLFPGPTASGKNSKGGAMGGVCYLALRAEVDVVE
ncbi:MAG TPA: hypothetical protein VGD74_02240 [Vulgatibacter sp.]